MNRRGAKDAKWETLDVTPDLADRLHITVPADRQILANVEKYRTELIDTCLEQDDEAMEAYLTDGTPPSAEVLRKVGTPFFSTRPEGTGLGVTQCRRLVEGAGGTFRIESVEGQGTTVTFTLPKA